MRPPRPGLPPPDPLPFEPPRPPPPPDFPSLRNLDKGSNLSVPII